MFPNGQIPLLVSLMVVTHVGLLYGGKVALILTVAIEQHEVVPPALFMRPGKARTSTPRLSTEYGRFLSALPVRLRR
jgi:hypothetical protein